MLRPIVRMLLRNGVMWKEFAALSKELLSEGFGQADTVSIMSRMLGPAGTCEGFKQRVVCDVARDTAGVPEISSAALDLPARACVS